MAVNKTIRVRMYNVGFGDCFLLTLPGKRTILVDAGFHTQGQGAFGGKDLVDKITQDLVEISGQPRIDVVIATHRHQDHVYAFNAEEWDEVEVGEVWLPWVEDRQNTQATKLWKKQARFAAQLASAVPSFGLNPADREDVEFKLWNAGVDLPGAAFAVGGNGWSNARALDRLHDGFARRDRTRPRFLPEKQTFPELFESPSLPGVQIHVMGPPRDPDMIEELDPEADGETYRALALRAAAVLGASGKGPEPFGKDWQVPPDLAGNGLEPAEIDRLDDLALGADAVLAAQKVDDMINSTSLVLVLQIGKARLLLPGDAEWGTWKRILESDDARSLLRGATFFKVGHHGSHNATSKTLVESVLPRKIPAMISTQQGAGNFRNNIPLADLLAALDDHAIHYVRSDRTGEKLPKGFTKGEASRWVDAVLPC